MQRSDVESYEASVIRAAGAKPNVRQSISEGSSYSYIRVIQNETGISILKQQLHMAHAPLPILTLDSYPYSLVLNYRSTISHFCLSLNVARRYEFNLASRMRFRLGS